MSGQIKVGDLVILVKPTPCGCSNGVGKIFKVTGMETGGSLCLHCKKDLPAIVDRALLDGRFTAQLERLKRIPPLGELEGEKREENLKEPA